MNATMPTRFLWLGCALALSSALGACASTSEPHTEAVPVKAAPHESNVQEAPECTRYRLMGTAPMSPDAMQRLRDDCLAANATPKSTP